MAHLDGHFFVGDLRKPDFQRETAQWTPAKVGDLIRSFLDADLIPAIILWRAGASIFVIDGAHRLSAMLAWILDDYGDRKKSIDHAGGYITEEQRRVADRTRELVARSVGSYAEYKAFRDNRAAAPQHMQKRLSNLADNSFVAQWVTTTDVNSAENSFFKINQQGTPIDPTERRLIRSREFASAIASRSITHAGSGHKYWKCFAGDIQQAIETGGKDIYNALYNPPITGMPLTTLDVPVAGKGYNALPFVFDLVNYANNVRIADSTSKKDDKAITLPTDNDGAKTAEYLKEVRKIVDRITGDTARSLGLHPVVYFYTRSGTFQPTVFLAVSSSWRIYKAGTSLSNSLNIGVRLKNSSLSTKEATTLLMKQLGSGSRHIPRLREYYSLVMKNLIGGKGQSQIEEELAKDPSLAFLTNMPTFNLPPDLEGIGDGKFKRGTKTAAFFAAALPNGARCHLCGALVHRNSIQFDHDKPRRIGGVPRRFHSACMPS